MHKLAEVEEARVLMTEGQNWGVWRWLLEKRRVREAADRATEALAKAAKSTRRGWSDDLKRIYRGPATEGDAEKVKAAVRRVKEADEEARQATDDAEEMFEEAERRMSTEMARQAAAKALVSYDLREKAIRAAEALGKKYNVEAE